MGTECLKRQDWLRSSGLNCLPRTPHVCKELLPRRSPTAHSKPIKFFYFVYFNDSALLAASVSGFPNPNPWLALLSGKGGPKKNWGGPTPQAKRGLPAA